MKPHRTDGVSLTFGLIFLAVVLFWGFARVITIDLAAIGWIVASSLLLFGILGVLGALRSGRRTADPVQAEAAVEVPADVPPQMHADIVRELLDAQAARVPLDHPTVARHSRD
jgi:vacuolar-type H+-ATPase subunit I/STV1